MKENEDYQLTPADGEDMWNIRMLSGDFVETVFNFGSLKVSEDGESLNYNYNIAFSPDEDLSVDNEEFRETVEQVLMSILESALQREEQK